MRFSELTNVTPFGSNNMLFEMSNLAPDETGLPFTVFVSPRGRARHGPRVKVTVPPWGSHPEAVYSLQPFKCEAGTDWLSGPQKQLLQQWLHLNQKVIEDFWNGVIHYDRELRAKVIPLHGAPPSNSREAIAALRASAPKVKEIYWHESSYILVFDRFAPNGGKLNQRFSSLGFSQPVKIVTATPSEGMRLWPS
jgi:hypothetical protein